MSSEIDDLRARLREVEPAAACWSAIGEELWAGGNEHALIAREATDDEVLELLTTQVLPGYRRLREVERERDEAEAALAELEVWKRNAMRWIGAIERKPGETHLMALRRLVDAALADAGALAERERCAKIADAHAITANENHSTDEERRWMAESIAAAIRNQEDSDER